MKKIVFITMVLMAFTMSSFAYVSLCNETVYADNSIPIDSKSGTLQQRPDDYVRFSLFISNDGADTHSYALVSMDYGYTVSISQTGTGSKSYNGGVDNNDSQIYFEIEAQVFHVGIYHESGADVSIWIP